MPIRPADRDPWAPQPTNGTVYLLHFDRPYKHARHYIGWTDDLDARLAAHQTGQGARLLAVVHAAGIGWTLARTWDGGRIRERQIKRQGGASRCCPLCGVRPRARSQSRIVGRDAA
jgi:predicted GIY-YIG superfamily endonuclease